MKKTFRIEIELFSNIHPTNRDLDCINVPVSIIGDILNNHELDQDEQTEKIVEYIDKNYELDCVMLKENDIYLETREEDDEEIIAEIEEEYEHNWSFGYTVDIEKIQIDYDEMNKV